MYLLHFYTNELKNVYYLFSEEIREKRKEKIVVDTNSCHDRHVTLAIPDFMRPSRMALVSRHAVDLHRRRVESPALGETTGRTRDDSPESIGVFVRPLKRGKGTELNLDV